VAEDDRDVGSQVHRTDVIVRDPRRPGTAGSYRPR
jgi:hypothetical protein